MTEMFNVHVFLYNSLGREGLRAVRTHETLLSVDHHWLKFSPIKTLQTTQKQGLTQNFTHEIMGIGK